MGLKEKLRKRSIRLEDLEDIEVLCRDVHFDVGYHNVKLYYEASPEGWNAFADEKDKVVAVSATNVLSNGLIYGYITVTREEYRGAGLAIALMPDFEAEPVMGSSNHLSIARRGLSGHYWLEKRHGMYGFVQKRSCEAFTIPKVSGVRIETVAYDSAGPLLAYDASVSLVDRKEFVRKWSLPPQGNEPEYGRSVVALDEKTGACLGYGTMRLFSDYYGIQPLYADNDSIASALMIALVKSCWDADAYLYMPLMASKRLALEFCYSLGMTITGTEVRNCSRLMFEFAKSLPIEKTYSVHEYYPV